MNTSFSFTMASLSRLDIIKKLIDHRLSEKEAQLLLGLRSTRQVRRIKKRVFEEGDPGVLHRSSGKKSNRALSSSAEEEILALIKKEYWDFKPTLAAEKLKEIHGITVSKETTRQLMIKGKLWSPKVRKTPSGRHVWRARKENFGIMEQFDGSYHHWLEERGGELCLLLAIDDATGRITHASFDENEGIRAVHTFWVDYIRMHGFPHSIYLDKFSTYKINHAAAVDTSELMTQFQRAMKTCDVNVIHAHSPQAKGRVERVFQTLQDRLVKELRLRNISTKEEANAFLPEYIKIFNAKFSVVPTAQANLHRALSSEMAEKLMQIFAVHTKRTVQNDYTIMFKTQYLQLAELQPVSVCKKDTVIMEEHLNGELKIACKGAYLYATVLPERPKKVASLPVVALTRNLSGHIPSENHPWRGNHKPQRSFASSLT